MYLNLKLRWTEPGKVTKYREVTKYRDVPVTIEKQRTVTEYKRHRFGRYFSGMSEWVKFVSFVIARSPPEADDEAILGIATSARNDRGKLLTNHWGK